MLNIRVAPLLIKFNKSSKRLGFTDRKIYVYVPAMLEQM